MNFFNVSDLFDDPKWVLNNCSDDELRDLVKQIDGRWQELFDDVSTYNGIRSDGQWKRIRSDGEWPLTIALEEEEWEIKAMILVEGGHPLDLKIPASPRGTVPIVACAKTFDLFKFMVIYGATCRFSYFFTTELKWLCLNVQELRFVLKHDRMVSPIYAEKCIVNLLKVHFRIKESLPKIALLRRHVRRGFGVNYYIHDKFVPEMLKKNLPVLCEEVLLFLTGLGLIRLDFLHANPFTDRLAVQNQSFAEALLSRGALLKKK